MDFVMTTNFCSSMPRFAGHFLCGLLWNIKVVGSRGLSFDIHTILKGAGSEGTQKICVISLNGMQSHQSLYSACRDSPSNRPNGVLSQSVFAALGDLA